MRSCASCGKPLGRKSAKGLCRACYRREYKKTHRKQTLESGRAYYRRNKPAFQAKLQLARQRLRVAMIRALGGKCACCGETEVKFLCLDHIKSGGRREYENKGGPIAVWRRAIREGLPQDKYRILCWNCNAALGLLGSCPHSQLTSPVFRPQGGGSSAKS